LNGSVDGLAEKYAMLEKEERIQRQATTLESGENVGQL
jgi:hypothetical protein